MHTETPPPPPLLSKVLLLYNLCQKLLVYLERTQNQQTKGFFFFVYVLIYRPLPPYPPPVCLSVCLLRVYSTQIIPGMYIVEQFAAGGG